MLEHKFINKSYTQEIKILKVNMGKINVRNTCSLLRISPTGVYQAASKERRCSSDTVET